MMGIPDIISYKAFGITFAISLEVVKAGIWNENNMKKRQNKPIWDVWSRLFLRLSIFIEAWNINFWSLISNKPERNHNLVLVQLKEKP